MKSKEQVTEYFPYVFILCMSLVVFVLPISGDELWNYSFARNICNGKVPYTDFNMLQTPLSAYISAFFLKIFGTDLLVFRAIGALLFTATFCLMYKICNEISQEKWMSFVATISVSSWLIIIWIYNYNNLNLLLLLIIIYLEVCIKENANQNYNAIVEFCIGIFFGWTFVIKQSTGIVLLVANVAICLYDRFFTKKNKIIIWLRVALSFVPALSFFIYSFLIGNLIEFWDYTVLGVGEFSHLISIAEFMKRNAYFFVAGLFPFIVIIYSIIKITKRDSRIAKREHVVVLLISIMGGVVAYPLTDCAHMFVAIAPYMICLFGCIKYKPSKRDNICCIIGSVLIGAIFCLSMIPNRENNKICELPYLKGIPINVELEKNIKSVDEYIATKEAEGIKVLIADDNAVAYMIPLGKYNKNFDMLLLGNLGTNTADDLLKQEVNAIYLVRRDESGYGKHSQVHLELIHKIKDVYLKIDEVEQFDAYIKSE